METEHSYHQGQVHPWQKDLWQALKQRYIAGGLAHAYLLIGAAGIGKTDFAHAFAGYLLCQQPAEGVCGYCKGCLLFNSGNHPDLLSVCPEQDSRVIKVEQVRAIGQFAQQTAHGSASRVVILAPAEALNTAAANSLLKVLEEPPVGTFFLLLSHQPGLLMPTVRSRCQIQRMPVPDPDAAGAWLHQHRPDCASQDLADALAITVNRPLAALEALEQDLPALRRELLGELVQVLKTQKLPIELAKQYDKANRVQILTLMLNALWSLLRHVATRDPQYLYDPVLRELAAAAGCREGAPGINRVLLELVNLTTVAVRQLESGSNPNPALVLEHCVIQWQSRLGGAHGPR